MKARLLKKILNDTKYLVHNTPEYIAIGGPMCHNLISVDKKTLQLKYALDTFCKGRKAVVEGGREELAWIWDKLQELIDTGEINHIIKGNDELPIPLPVYFFTGKSVVKTYTDAYGYPNITISGELMYDNQYFASEEEAVRDGISACEYDLKHCERRIAELNEELTKLEQRREASMAALGTLLGQQASLEAAAVAAYNKRLAENNNIRERDIELLLDGSTINGKMEIVEAPKGKKQDEDEDLFLGVWVDQHTTGEDSYGGHIYAKLARNKWLKIPYYC